MANRRIVITGLGIVSPLGLGIGLNWDNILSGKSGIRPITHFDTSSFSTKFAGTVPDFTVADCMGAKESRKTDLFVQYGVTAAAEAIKDSGIEDTAIDKDRVGVFIGSGIGGIGTIENNTKALFESGPRRISPFFIPGSIINMSSGWVSMLYGFRGPNISMATACTTAAHSIGLAARAIAYGDADVILAGGAEKASTPLGVGGFAAARALSTRNDAPEEASRPWDVDRDGFVLGDGSGILVLEEYEHAKKRGAKVYAELLGFGMSADAFHITRPSSEGAILAMTRALKDAKLNAAEVQYINAHGTSTPAGDVEETRSIKKVLNDAAANVAVSSTKSMTGHLLGAAGAIEAIYTILAIKDQVAPPTININNPDEGCDLNYVPHQPQKMTIQNAMSNSFGFGGTNGTLVFGKA